MEGMEVVELVCALSNPWDSGIPVSRSFWQNIPALPRLMWTIIPGAEVTCGWSLELSVDGGGVKYSCALHLALPI